MSTANLIIWVFLGQAPAPAAPTAIPADAVGRLTAVVGPVRVNQRDSEPVRGVEVESLRSGDRVATGPGGAASFFLADGVAIQLGADTTLSLTRRDQAWSLTLESGQARFVGGGIPIEIITPTTRLAARRGIIWVAVTKDGTRVWSERGSVNATPAPAPALRSQAIQTAGPALTPVTYQEPAGVAIAAGQEATFGADGSVQGPLAASGQGWNIPVGTLPFAGAAFAQANRGAAAEELRQADETPEEPDLDLPDSFDGIQGTAQVATGSSISLALGSISGSSSTAASGGLFSDAQQDSANLAFPGSIHLLVAQTNYNLSNVSLSAADNISARPEYWSIGVGAPPTGQVRTDFITGTGATPKTVAIPGFDAYIVQLDQYGMPAFGDAGLSQAQVGITGLVGTTPASPSIQGAAPLVDNRAEINQTATFALGELSVTNANGHPTFALRRADQDRRIVKDPGGNDDNDQITPNSQAAFTDGKDNKFQPNVPTVKVPTSLANAPSFAGLSSGARADMLRKAAFTTLMAEKLHDYSRRTGQTRFVVDGKIVDITGYRR